jgi:hypothetical protein
LPSKVQSVRKALLDQAAGNCSHPQPPDVSLFPSARQGYKAHHCAARCFVDLRSGESVCEVRVQFSAETSTDQLQVQPRVRLSLDSSPNCSIQTNLTCPASRTLAARCGEQSPLGFTYSPAMAVRLAIKVSLTERGTVFDESITISVGFLCEFHCRQPHKQEAWPQNHR